MWTYDILIVITYYMRYLLEQNVFFIQIMAAKERYAESHDYARFVERLSKTVDDMYRFKDDPDIAMLITQVDRLLEDESIQHYVKYKYSRDRELHLDTFKSETLCRHDEYRKLNKYFRQDKLVEKNELAAMVSDYCCNGLDSVVDKLVMPSCSSKVKSRREYIFEVYRLDSDEFLGEFDRVNGVMEILDVSRNVIHASMNSTKGINKKHNFKVIRTLV